MRKPTLLEVALVLFIVVSILATSHFRRENEALTQEILKLKNRVTDSEKKNASMKNELEGIIHSSPVFTLERLHGCLDGIENADDYPCLMDGQEAFLNWFVPEIGISIQAGASKKSINDILDRVYVLALKHKYISTEEKKIDESGPTALRKYLDGLKGPSVKPENKAPSEEEPDPEGPRVPDSQNDDQQTTRKEGNLAGRFHFNRRKISLYIFTQKSS